MGGAGPDATVDLQIKLLRAMKLKLNILSDQDHYRIIVDNNCELADRNHALLHEGNSPLEVYINGAKTLEKMGADIILLPCNTAHAYFVDIQNAISVEMINMIDITSQFIFNYLTAKKVVGLLSTEATKKVGLYHNALSNYGIQVESLDIEHQCKVNQAIYGIKAGFLKTNKRLSMIEQLKLFSVYKEFIDLPIEIRDIRSPVQLLLESIVYLKNKGVDNIILGCTELPLVLNNNLCQDNVGLIDPTNILAHSAIERALLHERKLL